MFTSLGSTLLALRSLWRTVRLTFRLTFWCVGMFWSGVRDYVILGIVLAY